MNYSTCAAWCASLLLVYPVAHPVVHAQQPTSPQDVEEMQAVAQAVLRSRVARAVEMRREIAPLLKDIETARLGLAALEAELLEELVRARVSSTEGVAPVLAAGRLMIASGIEPGALNAAERAQIPEEASGQPARGEASPPLAPSAQVPAQSATASARGRASVSSAEARAELLRSVMVLHARAQQRTTNPARATRSSDTSQLRLEEKDVALPAEPALALQQVRALRHQLERQVTPASQAPAPTMQTRTRHLPVSDQR